MTRIHQVTRRLGYILAGLSLALATSALAKKPAPPKMDPMMQKMLKNGTPNAAHKKLQPLVGKWNYSARFWMAPGSKPDQMSGTSTNKWALGGRYVMQNVGGAWHGQAFEGIGYTGYDNVKGKYVSIWLDNMSTTIMQGEGKYNGTKKTVTQSGHFSCPMTEKQRWFRSEWKMVNKNRHVYTSYSKTPAGKIFKSMEIVYTRAG